ncbi:MAG: hypothetical protein NUV96_02180 [Candidatus Colwellbacteria bacterium]|nr:hypothetical protein [Candidatus Colwellbacteria bacterium]
METVKIDIKKPMYNNHVYLNARLVERAIRLGAKLEITVPAGTAIVDPLEWKNKKDWMKKVFKFANNPMLLYGGNVPIPIPQSITLGEILLSKAEAIRVEKRKMAKAQRKLF